MDSEDPGPEPAGSSPEPDRADPAPVRPTRADVGASRSDSRWTVSRMRWASLLPDVPDDVVTLLATPIVVSVDPPGDAHGDAHRGRESGEDDDEDGQGERYPAPAEPCADLSTRYDRHRPRFLSPTGLGPVARARHRV